jgi:hypothetical protein
MRTFFPFAYSTSQTGCFLSPLLFKHEKPYEQSAVSFNTESGIWIRMVSLFLRCQYEGNKDLEISILEYNVNNKLSGERPGRIQIGGFNRAGNGSGEIDNLAARAPAAFVGDSLKTPDSRLPGFLQSPREAPRQDFSSARGV